MEPEGPQTEEGGTEVSLESNVVPLPRDWLGPREELVPFGALASPPSASDFWGEHSAEVQDVLQAPQPVIGERRAASAESVRKSRRSTVRSAIRPRSAAMRQWRWRAGPSRRRWANDSGGAPATDREPLAPSPDAGESATRSRKLPMIVIGVVLTGCVVLAVRTLEATSPVHVQAGTGAANRIAASLKAKRLGLGLGGLGLGVSHHRPAARARKPHHSRAIRRQTQAGRSVVARAASAPAPSPTPATHEPASASGSAHTAPAYSAPASTYTSPVESSGSPATSAPSTSSGSSSGGGGSGASAPAGPTGAGAPFGPGHLG